MIGDKETLVLSPRTTVEVGVLDGDETDSADIIVASRSGGFTASGEFPVLAYSILQPKVYSVCSVRSINGEAVLPLKSEQQYRVVAKRFTVAEKKVLGAWAQPHYSPTEEATKNELSALPSDE